MNVNSMARSAILVGLSLVLAACQTMGGGGGGGGAASSAPSSLDPRLANNHSAEFFSKSGLQACGVGAVGGALACLLANPSNKGRCMLIAAAAGCGVGMGANYYIDNQRAQYANTEDRLDASIADVRKDNQELQSLASTARQVIADDKRKIAKLRKDIAAKTVQQGDAQRQLDEIDANTAYLKKTLADVAKKQKEWEQVAAAQPRGNKARMDVLNAEIRKLKRQKEQLEKEVDQMYAQRSAIRLS